jgi:hypothetical protein
MILAINLAKKLFKMQINIENKRALIIIKYIYKKVLVK